jgi:GDP/GTP exchange factor required for growth at low temperature
VQKCYSLNNYATLVAIITGLRSDWVSRAMRKLWNRVNVYNLRMLNDLTSFVSREDDFCHIRSAMRALEESKLGPNDETGSSISSSIRGGKDAVPPSGVPFVGTLSSVHAHKRSRLSDSNTTGIYLSQLYRFSQLPDLIDPTAPTQAVGIDRTTNSFHTPAHPEVFATLALLPSSMQLEPLINVHKQRLIAGTIKSLVAGQHLASRVAHAVDKKLFQRCLKLRGLDPDTLQRVQTMYAGP